MDKEFEKVAQNDDKKPVEKKKPVAKKKDGEENSNSVKNVIELEPVLNEATNKTVVLSFGRMNPVTVGHEKLVNKIKSVAKSVKGTPIVYLTHSQDPKKNPLKYKDKVMIAQKAFGNIVKSSQSKTIIRVMQELEGKFDKVIFVAGQDRVKDFETLLNKYNGKEYNFDAIEVVSAGDRDPDADGVGGMSASKMRELASQDDMKSFVNGLPKSLKGDAKEIYDMVRTGMNLAEELENLQLLDEALSPAQRRAKGIIMRRYKNKMKIARARMKKRAPTMDRVKKIAQKRARDMVRKRISGKKDLNYNELDNAQKSMIDKKLVSKKAMINRIAKKILPKVKKELYAKMSEGLDLEFENLIEGVAQDSDIKDKEGTQPAKYHKGLAKSTKDKRDAHFKKGAEMNDDNPKAYKPAPGDADAKTKESDHTKKFKQMYGEEVVEEETKTPTKRFHEIRKKDGSVKLDRRFRAFRNAAKPVDEASNLEAAKKEAEREKEALKREHEREIRSAKIADARVTEEIELENDADLLALVEEIWEEVELAESKVETALKAKADKTKMPYGVLKKVYDRGVAAWRTGHRPGTTPSQWGMARVNSFVTKSSGTWGKADSDLAAKVRSEEVELDSFFDLNESFDLMEMSIIDKAIAAIHKHVTGGTDLSDIAYDVSRARGVTLSARELEKAYIAKHGEPKSATISPAAASRLKKRYGFKEEGGAGDFGTDKLTKKYKKDTPCGCDSCSMNEEFEMLMEEDCQLIGMKQIKAFEKIVDQLFKKFNIDFNFTRHFGDRMNDDRNTPCISMKELAEFIKKIYAKQGKSLKGIAGAEAVIKDIQKDLNIPVAVTYDAKNDEFDVVMKTIMRKKNFKTPNKVITY